jgi:hypothetical protein
MDTTAGAAAAAPAVAEASGVAAAPLALAAPTPAPSLAASATPVPRDALAMEHLLASMGLQPGSYQPKVIAQLMEVMQRTSPSGARATQMQERAARKREFAPALVSCIRLCTASFLRVRVVFTGYTREILEDAQDYCQHRDHTGKATIGEKAYKSTAGDEDRRSATAPLRLQLVCSISLFYVALAVFPAHRCG